MNAQYKQIALAANYMGKGSKQTLRTNPAKIPPMHSGHSVTVELQVWAQGRPGTKSRLQVASVPVRVMQGMEGERAQKAGTWVRTKTMP